MHTKIPAQTIRRQLFSKVEMKNKNCFSDLKIDCNIKLLNSSHFSSNFPSQKVSILLPETDTNGIVELVNNSDNYFIEEFDLTQLLNPKFIESFIKIGKKLHFQVLEVNKN